MVDVTVFRWMRRTRKGPKNWNSLLGDGKEPVEVVVVDQQCPSDVEEAAGQGLEIGCVGDHGGTDVVDQGDARDERILSLETPCLIR